MEVPTLDQLEPVNREFPHKNVMIYNKSLGENSMDIFNKVDKYTIAYYTANGYDSVNRFLYESPRRNLDKGDKIIKLLTLKFPKEPTQDDDLYFKMIMYYYIVNLYTTIQKFPKSQSPFKVYRGTKTHYLSEETDKKFYFNCFTSTSYNYDIAKAFGKTKYVFYVDPLCDYINASMVSTNKSECEILFSPYHICSFIEKEDENTYCYIILPTDLTIPDSFDSFMTWKGQYITKAKGGMGKIDDLSKELKANTMNTSQQPRVNSDPSPPRENTPKINTNDPTKLQSGFEERMSQPIQSFGGSPLTAKEKKLKDELISFFNVRK